MNACCEVQDNREIVQTEKQQTVEQCAVCGRKHYTLHAEPLHIQVFGEEM